MRFNAIVPLLLPVCALQAQEEAAAAQPVVTNPLRVALQRWYQANHSNASVPAGAAPYAMAFDGSSMWISNSGSVAKLRASDGQLLKHIDVPAGAGSLAFDGANMWVSGGNSVTKLRASDGGILLTVTLPQSAGSMVFDGTYVWVVIGSFPASSLARVRASDGMLMPAVKLSQVAESIAFDGAYIWVAQGNGTVLKVRRSDGGTVATYGPFGLLLGMAFDGANIWLADNTGSVVKLRAGDGSVLGTFPLPGFNPVALVFDASSMWVTSQVGNAVKKLRLSDGVVLATVTLPASPGSIPGVIALTRRALARTRVQVRHRQQQRAQPRECGHPVEQAQKPDVV